jgi:hypothetical protein
MTSGFAALLELKTERYSTNMKIQMIYWRTGALSLRAKWSGHEADHSPPSRAEVKE